MKIVLQLNEHQAALVKNRIAAGIYGPTAEEVVLRVLDEELRHDVQQTAAEAAAEDLIRAAERKLK